MKILLAVIGTITISIFLFGCGAAGDTVAWTADQLSTPLPPFPEMRASDSPEIPGEPEATPLPPIRVVYGAIPGAETGDLLAYDIATSESRVLLPVTMDSYGRYRLDNIPPLEQGETYAIGFVGCDQKRKVVVSLGATSMFDTGNNAQPYEAHILNGDVRCN